MGQYHLVIDLDACEFLDPHQLGAGLKAWEQVATRASTPQALFVLLTCSNGRGGGDFKPYFAENREPVIGRGAGHRIAVVGDYAKAGDFAAQSDEPVSELYDRCRDGLYRDITALVRPVLARELGVRYIAEPWWMQKSDGSQTEHVFWRVERDPEAPYSVLPATPQSKDAL